MWDVTEVWGGFFVGNVDVSVCCNNEQNARLVAAVLNADERGEVYGSLCLEQGEDGWACGKSDAVRELYPEWKDATCSEDHAFAGGILLPSEGGGNMLVPPEWASIAGGEVTLFDELDEIHKRASSDKSADFGLSPMDAGARRMGHLL